MLDQEIKTYNNNIAEWLKTEFGKTVLIKGDEVIGFFNTNGEALSEGVKRFGLDSVLVRQIAPIQEEITIPALTLGILNANIAYADAG